MCRVVLLLAVVVIAPVSVTLAEPPPATTRPVAQTDDATRLRRLLEELAHDDGRVRERARIALMGMTRDELSTFRQIVAQNQPLLPSQTAVLREIVSQAFLSAEPYEATGDQGFLGVRLSTVSIDELDGAPAEAGGAVVIESRVLGFAGYRYLLDGDVIVGVGGEHPVPFRRPGDLAATVQLLPPGTTVPFQILRQGRMIEVAIKLDARPVELDQLADITSMNLERAIAADAYWKREFAPLMDRGML